MIAISPEKLGPIYTAVMNYNPFLMLLTTAITLYLIYINFPELKQYTEDIDARTWLILILILSSAFLVTKTYSDPPTTTGKMWTHINLAEEMAENYTRYQDRIIHRPEFYPLTLATSFKIFGKSPETVEILGALLTTLTALGVFLSTYLITGRDIASLASTIIYSLLPLTLQQATKGNALVLYGFLACMTFTAFLLSLKTQKRKTVLLAGTLYILTLSTRMETVLMAPMFVLGYLAYFRREDFRKMVIPGFILLIIGLQTLPFLAQSIDNFGYNDTDMVPNAYDRQYPEGANRTFSLSNMPRNIPHMTKELERNNLFKFVNPLLMIIMVVGALNALGNDYMIFPILWLSSIILFFGTWFGGSIISLGYHLLQLMMPTAILLAGGIDTVVDKIHSKVPKISLTEKAGPRIGSGLLITFLILTPSIAGTFHIYQKNPGVYTKLEEVNKELPREKCIVTESKPVTYHMNPVKLLRFSTDSEVRETMARCKNPEMYYLEVNQKLTPKNLSEEYYSTFNFIKSICGTRKVNETIFFDIHKIECNIGKNK